MVGDIDIYLIDTKKIMALDAMIFFMVNYIFDIIG